MIHRLGLSLLEMMIAVVLFSTLMIVVTETAIGVRGFTGQHDDLLDLEREGRAILQEVVRDLSNSGRFSASGISDLPHVTPPDAATFGNEIWFLRIRAVAPGSAKLGIDQLDFTTAISRMDEWKTPRNTVPGLVADEEFVNNGPTRLVTPVWEPIGSRVADRLTYAENRDPHNLRIYCYRVVPASSGRGALRRYYKEGWSAPWQLDDSLGEVGSHIFSFVVEPPVNQRVRISLELRKDIPGRGRAIRRLEAVAAMRSAY
jgi:hypothetical protein